MAFVVRFCTYMLPVSPSESPFDANVLGASPVLEAAETTNCQDHSSDRMRSLHFARQFNSMH